MRFRKKARKSYLDDPDVRYMLAVKKGDRNAFDDLMRKYYPRILNADSSSLSDPGTTRGCGARLE